MQSTASDDKGAFIADLVLYLQLGLDWLSLVCKGNGVMFLRCVRKGVFLGSDNGSGK